MGERAAAVSTPSPAPARAHSEREKEAAPREADTRSPLRGANCAADLFVPLETAIHGGEVEVSYMVKGPCLHCRGHTSNRCPTCRGTRIAAYRKRETVTISAGAWDGQRVVVEGAGHPGTGGGAAGDAIFSVAIVCSSAFRRDGLNVACDIDVDCVTAILGGRIEAHVLGKAIPVTIQPDSQPGTAVRLQGQGLSDRNGGRGDLTLRLTLAMPAASSYLTGDERERLRQMFAAAQHRATQTLSEN
jgi:molecular chaperone DnaJ